MKPEETLTFIFQIVPKHTHWRSGLKFQCFCLYRLTNILGMVCLSRMQDFNHSLCGRTEKPFGAPVCLSISSTLCKKKVTVIIDYLKFLPTVHRHNRPTNSTTPCSVFLDKGLDRQTSTRLKSKYNESVQW